MSAVRSSLLSCALLAGCGSLTVFPVGPGTDGVRSTPVGSTSDTGTTDPGTDAPTGPTDALQIRLLTVDPPFGSTAGGQEIRLTGIFDVDTEVDIGGNPATVVDRSDSVLTVSTPASASTGPVGVSIRSAAPDRQASLEGAFTYHADASGEAGIIGMVGVYDVVGDYWVGDGSDFAFGAVAFVDGASDWTYEQGYADSLGGCRYSTLVTTWPADPTLHDLGVSEVGFTGTSTVFELDDGPVTGGWYSAEPSTGDLEAGQAYDLDPIVESAAWPEFRVRDAVEIPPGFSLIAPYLDTATLDYFPRQVSFQWNGTGGDFVLIQIRRELLVPAPVKQDQVTCMVPDTGSFTLPANVWPTWSSNDTLYFQVGRALVDGQALPHNNAENRVAGIYWVFGAGLSI